jgi:lipopolysaccharide/colanic/teichoic acid biosynthesis glycosyltransferase
VLRGDDGLKILVIASLTKSLVHFRQALLEDFVRVSDKNVIACAPEQDEAVCAELARMGVRFRKIPMERASTNAFADLRCFGAILAAIRDEKPDIVLAYTQKPIIYGGIAARLCPGTRFFALQSGLGYVYSAENKNAALRRFVSFLYRLALAKAETVFVFNRDDAADMRAYGIIGPRARVIQLAGSGVDPARYPEMPLPEGPPVFLLVARLMRDKGIFEFAEAARRVRAAAPEARFQVLGPFDANPAGIKPADMERWAAQGAIDYLGETDDVRPFLAGSTVFVLPSFHREGLPRSILEAMSTGRAVITTDAPGCRETVIDGENGFLVPPQDPEALAEAMLRCIRDPALARRFGARSRRLVEEIFDVRLVNRAILKAMNLNGPAPEKRARPKHDLVRRIGDILISGVALVFTAPLMAFVAVVVYFDLGSPLLFRQERAGGNGRPFELIKFRTMTNARDAEGALLSNDERLTRIGCLLRRLRLDELPELWNVLRGEMAIVGPRPLFCRSAPNVEPHGGERLSVRPGLTGWAQINGNALLDDDHKLQLDLWYVRNRSLKLDAYIILRTLWVIIAGERVNAGNIKAAHESNHRRSR